MKAYEDAKTQLDIALANTASMQKEIDGLKENESKLQIDCQARISAAERKSSFTSKELTDTKLKLEKALTDHDRKDAEYSQLKRELDRTQVSLMNVREDLREAQEKAAMTWHWSITFGSSKWRSPTVSHTGSDGRRGTSPRLIESIPTKLIGEEESLLVCIP